MKKIYIYFIALLVTSFGFAQSEITITTSGGSFPTEKWVSITTAIDGGGTQIWGQGDGTQCNGNGLLTNELVMLAPGTYYVNCYDNYDDSWDGTVISVEAYGSVIGNNGGVSPDDGLDTDASFTCEGTPDELEASFEIIVPAPPACLTPSALTATSITETTADLGWTENGTATAWDVEIVDITAAGTPTGTPTVAGVTNPYSATGLSSDNNYEFYVRADCGGSGTSGWVGPFAFSTPVPDPTCANGTFLDSGGTSGDYDINENITYTICPDNPGDVVSVEFTAFSSENNGAAACYDGLTVHDGPDALATTIDPPGGGTVWCWDEDDFTPSGTGDLEGITIISTDPSGCITFVFTSDGSVTREGWEAIVTCAAPPACFDPSTLTATNVAATSADLGWTENGTATSWDVEIVDITAAGAFTGTPTAAGVTNPYNATGLTPENDYEFYVRADCGVDGTSAWVGPVAFTTIEACPAPSALTASNIMETSADLGWTENGAATAWNVEIVDLTAAGVFTGTPTATGVTNPYSATGLVGDNSYEYYVQADCGVDGVSDWSGPFAFATPYVAVAPDCTNGTFLDSGGLSGDYSSGENITYTICPDNPGDIVSVEFTAFSSENNGAAACYDGLTVHDGPDALATTVDPPGGGTIWCWDEDDFVPGGTGDLEGITITSTDPSGCITFVFTSDGSVNREGWEAIVTCSAPPTCPEVSDITHVDIDSTSVDIFWTNGGSETNWEVVVQAPGGGEPAAANDTGDNESGGGYFAGGLTANTTYEVWVRAECTLGSDFSDWVGPYLFTTQCDAFSLPLLEGFESGVPPDCWDSFRGANNLGATHDWISSGTANSGSGAAFVRYSIGDGAAEDWLVSPAMNFSGSTNPEVSFFARDAFGIDYGSNLTVRVSTTDKDYASFTTLATYTEADLSQTYGQLSVDLSAYNTDTNVYVAFVWSNDDGDSLYIDDVVVYDNVPTTFTYTSGTWAPFNPTGIVDFDDDLIIAAGDYTMTTDMTCNAVFVDPGAGLIVDTGVTLNNVGPLVLQSTSTSYSSLIRNGDVLGIMLYQRHVNINGTGTTGSNDLVSAPLTGQQFDIFATNNPNILNNGTLFLFGPFEKNTGQYVNWAATETSTLDAGVGYRTGTTNNLFVTFQGVAENGVVTNTILNQGTNNEEWNLIGNPYPSYMNVQDFLNHDGGSGSNISLFDGPTAAIWGYDGNALNGWTIYNLATTTPSTVITPGQGFFVSSGSAAATVEFTPAMRSTGSSDDFIVGRNAPLTYVTLSLTSNTNAYSTDFYFNANASEGFDRGYDAAVWGETTPEFAIYSRLVQDDAGFDMALQALKDSDITNVTIPLGVNANQGQQITFSIHESTLPENVKVFLDDTVENTTTLLNAGDYVMTPKGDLSGTGRFFLRYEEDALSSIENSLDALDIFTLNDTNELIVSGELAENAMLNLFDIQGRLVMSIELDKELVQNRINVENINAGIYLATVIDSSQEKTKKLIIK